MWRSNGRGGGRRDGGNGEKGWKKWEKEGGGGNIEVGEGG